MDTLSKNDTLIEAMKWRYAVKKFDADRKIDEKDFEDLCKAIQLSASSYGLQPYAFVVVRDPEMRKKLRELSMNQSQITDASHMIVFAAQKKMSSLDVDKYATLMANTRQVPLDALDGLKSAINGTLDSKSDEEIFHWNSDQTYLALGNLLTSAALLNIDACPMEGFQRDKYDEVLGLDKLNLASRAVVTLGYRSEEDAYARARKVRKGWEDLFIER